MGRHQSLKEAEDKAFWRFVSEQRAKHSGNAWTGRRRIAGALAAWMALMPLIRKLSYENQVLKARLAQEQE